MQISNLCAADFELVLALNAAAVPHVNLIDTAQLQWFADNAASALVARDGKRLAGFLIGLRPGTDYASPNYRWFCAHRDDFAYIDRVVVSDWARRQGVAAALYRAFARAQHDAPVLTCEVNLQPSNPGSIAFHERLGFRQIGSQEIDDGQKEVALMEKTL